METLIIPNTRSNPGFLHLYPLGDGGGQWLHMCIRHQETTSFLMDNAMLEDLIVDAMVQEDTRSRIRVHPDGIMVLLKATHVRNGSNVMPEDMISMRIWIDETDVITTREADVDPISEMVARTKSGTAPTAPGEFLADLIKLHLDQIEPLIEVLEDRANELDGLMRGAKAEAVCMQLADVRSQASGFLRQLTPQKQVFETLCRLDHAALSERSRNRFEDALDQLLHLLETLQSVRERSDIVNDQIARAQERQLNKTSLIFALVATVFLPLSFVTGLFGANLRGIPMATHPLGFVTLTASCLAISLLLIIFFRLRRWF